MDTRDRYRNIVIGSGEGGKYLAWHLARSGERTAVVERRWIGGSCPNINCLPSKNVVASARVAHLAHQAAQFGLLTADASVDMMKVRQRKREMVEAQVAAHLERFSASGAELIMGNARVTGPKTIEVTLNEGGTRTLTSDRLFLNVGTHAAIPDIRGLAEAEPLTHIEALELGVLPEHLLVLGAGYVGLEFAQAYRRFGSRVTVIERGARVAVREDPDVSDELARILQGEGIDILTDAAVVNVRGRSGEAVTLDVEQAGRTVVIEGSHIMVASGRVPNTAGIGLEAIGVELDGRGYIRVNERLETGAAGVWAIGECAGTPQFTHAAFDDFRVIRDNLAGLDRTTTGRLIPYCMFTDPPLARVGLSETEARDSGIAVRVAKLPASAILRARTTGETRGFLKALVGADDDRLVGFAMIGEEAGEVMAAVQTAMLADLPYTRLRDAILAHPTMAEGIGPLLSNVPPRRSPAPRLTQPARAGADAGG